jgi:hypothetical protein
MTRQFERNYVERQRIAEDGDGSRSVTNVGQIDAHIHSVGGERDHNPLGPGLGYEAFSVVPQLDLIPARHLADILKPLVLGELADGGLGVSGVARTLT